MLIIKYYHITGNLLQLKLFTCSYLQTTKKTTVITYSEKDNITDQHTQSFSKADTSRIMFYVCVTALKAQ